MALTTLVHVFAGGPEIYVPVRQSALPGDIVATLSVVWHAISLLLAGLALALAWLWRHENPALAWFMAVLQMGFAALFLGYGIADLGTVLQMPQWTIFLASAAFVVFGLRRKR